MTIYCLFSRKTGYPGGLPVKSYTSISINDYNDITKQFIDKSGRDIILLLQNIDEVIINIHAELLTKLAKLCETYPRWYYYPEDTVITDTRSYV